MPLSRVEPRPLLLLAACAWLLLALPPVRAWLEATMTAHMLLQLPMLAGIGFVCGRACMAAQAGRPGACLHRLQAYDAGGASGLLFASFAMVLWMLPRCLDLARMDPTVDALKFVSVPAAGMAVAVSWPRVPRIARAVIHLEVIATLLRFGWGYLAAEERLCLAYLAGDQQRAGELLLWAGALYALMVVRRPLLGPARETATPSLRAP